MNTSIWYYIYISYMYTLSQIKKGDCTICSMWPWRRPGTFSAWRCIIAVELKPLLGTSLTSCDPLVVWVQKWGMDPPVRQFLREKDDKPIDYQRV